MPKSLFNKAAGQHASVLKNKFRTDVFLSRTSIAFDSSELVNPFIQMNRLLHPVDRTDVFMVIKII